MKAEGFCRLDRCFGIVGMNRFRNIDGRSAGRDVGGRSQANGRALGRYVFEGEALAGQDAQSFAVDFDPIHDLGESAPSPRILVRFFDKLANGAPSVADHGCGMPARGGDQASGNRREAMIVSRKETLEQELSALKRRGRQRLLQFFGVS